jgi:NADH-quinone oxidoreductase subunit L
LYNWKGDALSFHWIVFGLAFVVSFLTVLYIFRFTYRIFFGIETVTQNLELADPPRIMRAPIALLGAASLWPILSVNPFASSGYLFTTDSSHHPGLTVFSAVWVVGAFGVAFLSNVKRKWFYSETLFQAFYLNQVQTLLIVTPTVALSYLTERIDRKWIDGLLHSLAYVQVTIAHLAGWWDKTIVDGSVNGMATLSRIAGSFTRSFQGGKIQLYIFWAIFTIIIFLIWSII